LDIICFMSRHEKNIEVDTMKTKAIMQRLLCVMVIATMLLSSFALLATPGARAGDNGADNDGDGNNDDCIDLRLLTDAFHPDLSGGNAVHIGDVALDIPVTVENIWAPTPAGTPACVVVTAVKVQDISYCPNYPNVTTTIDTSWENFCEDQTDTTDRNLTSTGHPQTWDTWDFVWDAPTDLAGTANVDYGVYQVTIITTYSYWNDTVVGGSDWQDYKTTGETETEYFYFDLDPSLQDDSAGINTPTLTNDGRTQAVNLPFTQLNDDKNIADSIVLGAGYDFEQIGQAHLEVTASHAALNVVNGDDELAADNPWDEGTQETFTIFMSTTADPEGGPWDAYPSQYNITVEITYQKYYDDFSLNNIFTPPIYNDQDGNDIECTEVFVININVTQAYPVEVESFVCTNSTGQYEVWANDDETWYEFTLDLTYASGTVDINQVVCYINSTIFVNAPIVVLVTGETVIGPGDNIAPITFGALVDDKEDLDRALYNVNFNFNLYTPMSGGGTVRRTNAWNEGWANNANIHNFTVYVEPDIVLLDQNENWIGGWNDTVRQPVNLFVDNNDINMVFTLRGDATAQGFNAIRRDNYENVGVTMIPTPSVDFPFTATTPLAGDMWHWNYTPAPDVWWPSMWINESTGGAPDATWLNFDDLQVDADILAELTDAGSFVDTSVNIHIQGDDMTGADNLPVEKTITLPLRIWSSRVQMGNMDPNAWIQSNPITNIGNNTPVDPWHLGLGVFPDNDTREVFVGLTNMISPIQENEERGEVTLVFDPATIDNWGTEGEYTAWSFVDFDYRSDYYGEAGYGQYIGHQLNASQARNAAFYVTIPSNTPPGRYQVDGTLSAIVNYEDDLFYPLQGDMVAGAAPSPQYGWDHYPMGGYIDPRDDDDNYSFPITATLRVEPYPALFVEVIEPVVIENESEDVELQVAFTNVGNVDLLDTRVFLNDATGVELGVNDKIEQADGTVFPAPEVLLRNIPVGQTVTETFPIDVLMDCPRDVYNLTFKWTADYRDIFKLSFFEGQAFELNYSKKVEKAEIAQIEVTNRPKVDIQEKDKGVEQQYILYKDHDEGDVEVMLVFTMQNQDEWANDNFEDMTAVLEGDMFDAPVYGIFEEGKEGENDVNFGNTVNITFWATFLKATPGGEYNATITITALTPSGIEEGVTSVEQRVYTVKIVVKKLKVVDPAEFTVYTTGVDLECDVTHFLDNDAEFDITDLNATLDYMTQDSTQIFENRNNSGYSAWGTFSAATIQMDGGADKVFVTFDPVLLPDAPAGTYNVMMTFTGMIGTPTGMAQPITMTYLWEFTVNNTRVRVSGGKAVGSDNFPNNAVFYAGEEFEELIVPIENMMANNQTTDTIYDVDVELFLGENQDEDDLGDYVTFANGVNTCLIDMIAPGFDGIARPGFRISIPKNTPPGTYACYMNIVYYDDDGNMFTEDYIPFDIIIEYTPFIEVTGVTPGVIEQDGVDSYYEEFEVTFVNNGNVDLYNVTLWTMLGCDFNGSGFWLLECQQPDNEHNDTTTTEFIYATDWAIGEERTYTYRLFINEHLHYGNWRIGIGQTGWYYDGGITGSTITEFVKNFNWNYRTGYDYEYPAHGTYIPLYVNLLPDFSIMMPTIYIPTIDIDVTLDGFVVSLRNTDPDVELGFGDVEIQMLENPIFDNVAPVDGVPMDYYVPGETVQLLNTEYGTMFYFPVGLGTGLVPREYRVPFQVTAFNRENVQDPAHSNQNNRTSGVIYVDCTAVEPAMRCLLQASSTALEQGGRLINLDLDVNSQVMNPDALYDAELNVFLGNTPYIYPVRTVDVWGNPIASDVLINEWQVLSGMNSSSGYSSFDIDLDVQRESGIYVIPTQLTGYLYSFQSDMVDQMFTYTGDYEVRLFPSPPVLHIVDMYTDEIEQGKEFNLTFVLRNSGGDHARNVYVNLWSFWWEDLERANTQYLFLDEFVNSISGKYKEVNHTGDWDYFEISSETDIFTQGDKVIRWRNMTLDELGVDGMSDIYNVSLDRERMLTSPRPAWDSLYFTEIESGEEIEVTYRMAADCHFLTCKPYQVEAYVHYEDSLEKSYGDSYNLTIFDETSVQDTSKKTLEEVTGYAMLAVVLLVIVIILLCFALYMLSSGGKSKKPASAMEEEDFPEEDEFEDEFEEEEFEDEMEEEPAFEEEPEMPEPEPEPMPEPEPEPSVEEELGSIEDEIKDIE